MAGLLACAGPFFKSQGAKKKAELVRAESDAPKETCSMNMESGKAKYRCRHRKVPLDMLHQPFYNRDYKMTAVKLLQ